MTEPISTLQLAAPALTWLFEAYPFHSRSLSLTIPLHCYVVRSSLLCPVLYLSTSISYSLTQAGSANQAYVTSATVV
jgi:hypothetical protein